MAKDTKQAILDWIIQHGSRTPASPIPLGWYVNRRDELLYVHSVAAVVGTSDRMVVFIPNFPDNEKGMTFVQPVDEFKSFLDHSGYSHVGPLPPGRVAGRGRPRKDRTLSKGLTPGSRVDKKS